MNYDNVKEHYKNHSNGLWADRVDKKFLYPQQLMFTRNKKIYDYLVRDSHISSKKILDFGAGYGDVSLDLAPIARHVVAADIIPYAEQIISASKFINIDFQILNARQVPFADSSFDYVILADVFEHFLPEDRTLYLNEFNRILKPGGELIIITPSLHTIIFYEYFDTLFLALVGKPQIPIKNHPLNFFLKKSELVKLTRLSDFAFRYYTKICFYPAPERLGFFFLVENTFIKFNLHSIFSSIMKPIFTILSKCSVLNQKMFLVVSKK